MPTARPVSDSFHSPSQYDRSGFFWTYMKTSFPKTGSIIFGGESQSFMSCRNLMVVGQVYRVSVNNPFLVDATAQGRAPSSHPLYIQKLFRQPVKHSARLVAHPG